MDSKTPYADVIKEMQDTESGLFGGSLAYIAIQEALAMLIKLLKLKLRKPSPLDNTYKTIITVSQAIMPEAERMITADGENFNKLRTAKTPEEKKAIVDELYPSSLAFLVNLLMVEDYLKSLIFLESSSIKGDYIMVFNMISATYNSLSSILKYEIRKMPDSEEKIQSLDSVEANDQKFEAMLSQDTGKEEN